MYIKPGPNYKMSKSLKASLALSKFKDAHHRGEWKRAMIQSELAAAVVPKSMKEDRRPKLLTGYVAVDGSLTGSDTEQTN